MPSLEETRRQVREGLNKQAQEADHKDILVGLQDEIDKHNAVKDDLRREMRRSKRRRQDREERSERSVKFRFKDDVSDPRKRKHRSRRHGDDDGHKRRKCAYPTPSEDEGEAAHPFPRDPEADAPSLAPGDDAFRDSLFDALADDEGAHYWESVYSQPIHVYPRPSVETPQGSTLR